jgi:mono/diheme cytochrome c family protein
VGRDKLLHILLGGALALALLVPLGAVAFVKSGLFNVGASKPHTKLAEWLTHETMIHSVRRHASGIAAPPNATAQQVRAGFCLYETHCVACHGAAAVARDQWVSGLEPSPPYLLDATSRFTPAELFWIAKNGIKMTGMPSWRDSLTDRDIWNVVAWIEASTRLPPQTYARWSSATWCAPAIGLSPAPAPPPTLRPEPARPTGGTGGSAPSSPGAARP